MLSTLTMQPDRGRNRRTGTPNDRSLAAAGAANGSVVRPTTLASARGRFLARRVAVRPAPPCCLLCHLAVSTGHCDFSAAHSALRRHVDRDILAGVSWAVLVGRDFWSTCNVSAGRTRRRTSRCALTTSSGVLEYQVGHFLCCLAAARGRQLLTRRPDRGVHTATGGPPRVAEERKLVGRYRARAKLDHHSTADEPQLRSELRHVRSWDNDLQGLRRPKDRPPGINAAQMPMPLQASQAV